MNEFAQSAIESVVEIGNHAVVDEDGTLDGKKKRYRERYLFSSKETFLDGRPCRLDVSLYVYPSEEEKEKQRLLQQRESTTKKLAEIEEKLNAS